MTEESKTWTPGAMKAAQALSPIRRSGKITRFAEIISRETRDREMVELLRELRQLFAGDPKGEYCIARIDGKPLCLADQMIVGCSMEEVDGLLAEIERKS